MKKSFRSLVLLTSFLFSVGSLHAQRFTIADFDKVDSLAAAAQPKAALALVEKINIQARADYNAQLLIKSVIYRMLFQSYLVEDSFPKIITDLKQDISLAKQPEKSILQSLLAENLWKFYQENSYRVRSRTNVEETKNEDIRTWSIPYLSKEIISTYLSSVAESEQLKRIPIDTYSFILKGDTLTRPFRSTLYDVLMHRALDVFGNTQLNLSTFENDLQLEGENSLKTVTLRLFDELLKFNQQRRNLNAQADVELKRARFLYHNNQFFGPNEAYAKALTALSTTYRESEIYADILAEQASLMINTSYLTAKESNLVEAFDLASQAIKAYPESIGANKAKNLITQLKYTELEVRIKGQITPQNAAQLYLSYRNIDTVFLKVYKLPMQKSDSDFQNLETFNDYVKNQKEVRNWVIALPKKLDYKRHTLIDKMEGLPLGNYLMIAQNGVRSVTINFSVTHMFASNRTLKNGDHQFSVVDAATGKGLKDVKIELKKNNDPSTAVALQQSSTNEFGISTIRLLPQLTKAVITYKRDSLISYVYSNQFNTKPSPKQVVLFTDRPIYRPGQTLHYKGLVLNTKNSTKQILPFESLEIRFNDANAKEIEKTKVKTNAFGTFQGSFQIPTGRLNGQMRLVTPYGTIAVQVEEYKRPKFEIFFDKGESYTLTDSIRLKGSAASYSGYAISNAKLKYVVFQRRHDYYQPAKQIAIGQSQLGRNGDFKIAFLPQVSDANARYSYDIKVDITDIAGETISSTKQINIGANPILLNVEPPTPLFLTHQTDSITAFVTNLNNDPIKAELKAEWELLKAPGRLTAFNAHKADHYTLTRKEFIRTFPYEEYNNENDPATWPVKTLKFTQHIKVDGKSKLTFNAIDLPEGYYKVKFSAKSTNNDTVSVVKIIRVYGEKPVTIQTSKEWLVTEKSVVQPHESAIFRIASIRPNSKAYYEIYYKDTIIEKVWLNLSTTQQRIEIKPRTSFEDNFAVQFTLIQNGVLFTRLEKVTIIDTLKTLEVKFLTFRDKLQPGEKESWKLQIRSKGNEKQAAELVATLYDASLDKLRKMDWPPSLKRDFDYSSYAWRFYHNLVNASEQIWNRPITQARALKVTRNYEDFNWYGYSYYGGYNGGFHNYLRTLGAKEPNAILGDSNLALNEVVVTGYGNSLSTVAGEAITVTLRGSNKILNAAVVEDNTVYNFSSIENPQLPQTLPRVNFNETAFFYPQLLTDENGEVTIEFTIPQSLTRYKMMGFAHTKDLKTAVISNELITQKQLAIAANAPRFLREGDTIQFTAKLNNLTAHALSGVAVLVTKNALTGKEVELSTSKASQSFELGSKDNTLMRWTLIIPKGMNAITYTLTASAGNYSDGEEMTLPVLPNAILVTETLPLLVKGNSVKTFTLEKLLKSKSSKTVQHQSLTLEFTANPIWSAIQALPSVLESNSDCSEQVFSKFYANAFATSILTSSPKIKAIFEQWGKTTLSSNLEKNQELKSILLEETPWVRNAEDEGIRKKRLSVLFDLNRMSYELKGTLEKLQQMQNANGSFSWFKGMREDRYITQHIVLGMAQLKKLKLIDEKAFPAVNSILNKAIAYLDGKFVEDKTSFLPLHYLYARSYVEVKSVQPKFNTAFDQSIQQLISGWKGMGPYQQAQIALVLNRMGNHTEAIKIIALLKQTAHTNEEMGMYWSSNQSGWYWYQNPIETQALLIEAFNEVAADGQAVEDMKTWLLKNKQTNDWKTTKATTLACYALLLNGYDVKAETLAPTVTLAGKNVSLGTMEAGTGYQKTTITGPSVTAEMGNIQVKNNMATKAWGALYWQYLEQLDKITPSASGVKIKKQLFLQKPTAQGNVLAALTSANNLTIGDVVNVRIEIIADRNMEYMHLKDMRSAAFEPLNVISQHKYQDGLSYYQSTKDGSTNFFFNYLPKGVYVFEYELRVTHSGNFANGVTSLQSMYAPEFNTISDGIRVTVK